MVSGINLCHKCGINERSTKGSYCRSCVRIRSQKWRKSEVGKAYLERYRLSGNRLASYIKTRDAGGFRVAKRKYSRTEKGIKANRIFNLKYHFKRKYGMSLEDRDRILDSQTGCCAACGDKLDTMKPRGLHVDHCHASGVIRGILCADCNVSLGRMKENPERIRRLANYAEKHASTPSFAQQPRQIGGGGSG